MDEKMKIPPPPEMTEEEGNQAMQNWVSAHKLTSMLHWWPIVKDLGIPVPKTVWHEVSDFVAFISLMDGEPIPEVDKKGIIAAADSLGYPVFMRTDLYSGKHYWENNCYVPSRKILLQNVWNLTESSLLVDLPLRAFVFREYIPPEESFTAFRNNTPIRKERRVFVRDGEIEEIFAYWPEHAMDTDYTKPSDPNWKAKLAAMNDLAQDDALLTTYAQTVAKCFEGYWSVDFMWARNQWYLIDMAVGEHSWHPEKRPQ